MPEAVGSTPKIASWGRSGRLRLSSAKPGKLANPSTLLQSIRPYASTSECASPPIDSLFFMDTDCYARTS